MSTAPCPASLHFPSDTVAAMSNAQGTVLPRSGVFWGVRPPHYHSAIIVGGLASLREHETQVRFWFEPQGDLLEQTSPTSHVNNLRLKNFEINLNELFTISGTDLTSSRLATDLYSSPATFTLIHNAAAPCAFTPSWGDSTDSSWLNFNSAIAPLLQAPGVVLEAIRTALEKRHRNLKKQHIGLSAVAWLIEALGLSRPTILRMGGVAESTFYSWQKNPQAAVRTPSVSRILRLQAQFSLLERVLGRDGLRAWMLTGDRLERLQEDDTNFTQVLAEAEKTVLSRTQIRPRPRLRLEDYGLDDENNVDTSNPEPAVWPRATKLTEEQPE